MAAADRQAAAPPPQPPQPGEGPAPAAEDEAYPYCTFRLEANGVGRLVPEKEALITNAPRLRTINLANAQLRTPWVAPLPRILSNNLSVIELNVSHNQLFDDDCLKLLASGFGSLQHLNFGYTGVSRQLWAILAPCFSQLLSLNVRGMPNIFPGQDELGVLEAAQQQLEQPHVAAEEAPPVAFPLRSLNLDDCDFLAAMDCDVIDADGLQQAAVALFRRFVACFANLQELSMRSALVGGGRAPHSVFLTELGLLTRLTSLKLDHMPLRAATVCAAVNPSCRVLCLASCNLPPGDIALLSHRFASFLVKPTVECVPPLELPSCTCNHCPRSRRGRAPLLEQPLVAPDVLACFPQLQNLALSIDLAGIAANGRDENGQGQGQGQGQGNGNGNDNGAEHGAVDDAVDVDDIGGQSTPPEAVLACARNLVLIQVACPFLETFDVSDDDEVLAECEVLDLVDRIAVASLPARLLLALSLKRALCRGPLPAACTRFFAEAISNPGIASEIGDFCHVLDGPVVDRLLASGLDVLLFEARAALTPIPDALFLTHLVRQSAVMKQVCLAAGYTLPAPSSDPGDDASRPTRLPSLAQLSRTALRRRIGPVKLFSEPLPSQWPANARRFTGYSLHASPTTAAFVHSL